MNVFSKEFLADLDGDKIFEPKEVTAIRDELKKVRKRMKSLKFMKERVAAKCAGCEKKVTKVAKGVANGDAVVSGGRKLCHDCFHGWVHAFCASVRGG